MPADRFFRPPPEVFLAPRDDSGVRCRDCFPYWEMRERFWEDFEYCLGPGCAGCPRLVQHEGRKDPPGRLRARPAGERWQLEQQCGEQWLPFEEPYRSLKDIVMTWKVQRGPHRRDERGVFIPLLWAHTSISARRVEGQADQVLREIETTVFEDPPWPFDIR